MFHVFEETVFACVDEWYRLLTTYHDGPACTPTTPGEESVRRAPAIQLIITQEWGWR